MHAEATVHLDRTLNFIRSHHILAGVSINPATPLSTIEHALDLADLLLLMSVNPGFGGQKYIPYVTEKIRRAREIIDKRQLACVIEVDGGIDSATARLALEAGANVLVAGSAVFGDREGVAAGILIIDVPAAERGCNPPTQCTIGGDERRARICRLEEFAQRDCDRVCLLFGVGGLDDRHSRKRVADEGIAEPFAPALGRCRWAERLGDEPGPRPIRLT